MDTDPQAGLSAREREIMDILFRLRLATAAEVRREMTDPPTDATVRSTLRVLEEKGWVGHQRDGARFMYQPIESRDRVKRRALGHVVQTFFDGSAADAVAALVGSKKGISEQERARIAELLREVEEE